LTILAISHQAALVDAADRVFQISSGEIKLVSSQSDLNLPAGA
jgi:ABC-type siderophore export system fused ATPase/permease subunit